MKIEWILLAEGIARDARGALTAVALNQNVLITSVVPAPTKRAVIAHVTVERNELARGEKIDFRFSVTGPSGDVLTAQGGTIAIDHEPPWLEISHVDFDVPMEVSLQIESFGRYRITFYFRRNDGSETSRSLDFYVVKPPEELKS